MSEEYTSSAIKLEKEFENKVRLMVGMNYWIARALVEIAVQLDAIRFELSGPKE